MNAVVLAIVGSHRGLRCSLLLLGCEGEATTEKLTKRRAPPPQSFSASRNPSPLSASRGSSYFLAPFASYPSVAPALFSFLVTLFYFLRPLRLSAHLPMFFRSDASENAPSLLSVNTVDFAFLPRQRLLANIQPRIYRPSTSAKRFNPIFLQIGDDSFCTTASAVTANTAGPFRFHCHTANYRPLARLYFFYSPAASLGVLSTSARRA